MLSLPLRIVSLFKKQGKKTFSYKENITKDVDFTQFYPPSKGPMNTRGQKKAKKTFCLQKPFIKLNISTFL
jgi:hypothetical protein